MRAREFITVKTILREYKRDITARQYGAKVLAAWKKSAESLYFRSTVANILGIEDDYSDYEQFSDQQILDALMAKFEAADPTPNNIYTPWIARQYGESNIRRVEDLDSRIKPLLAQYHQYKGKSWFPPHAKDIMRVNVHQLSSIMVNLNIPQEQQTDRGRFEEVYKDSEVRVIVPLNKTAACYYGQGTRWCTASTRGTNYFDQYNEQGPLYIILPQNPRHGGEKFQLHFESGQFMEENDHPINLGELLEDRFPQLGRLFEKELENLLEYAPDSFLRELYDAGVELLVRYFNDNFLEGIKNNRHYDYMDWLKNRGVDVSNMTSDELLKYERTLGYSFGEFDGAVDDIDDAIHRMQNATLDDIQQGITAGQDNYDMNMTAGDIGFLLADMFNTFLKNQIPEHYHLKIHGYMHNHITAKNTEYHWEPYKRKFKPYKKIGDWTIGEYE